MMKKILFLTMALTLLSCSNEVIYDDFLETKDIWQSHNFAGFNVDIKDTTSPFNFYINISHSVDYQYSNIYLFLKTVFPDKRYTIDTLECILCDKEGKWLGQGMGKYRNNQILFKQKGRFPMSGNYRFELEQGMRDTTLEGIHSIGIKIEKSNK